MFKVGDRVVDLNHSDLETHNPEDDELRRGEVEEINKDGSKFSVKWDYRWVEPNPSTHDADDLMLESEAEKILSKLEAEYETWAGPVREKMAQAAKLIEEAVNLASNQDQELSEMYDIVNPLLGALESVGWRTSSLSC